MQLDLSIAPALNERHIQIARFLGLRQFFEATCIDSTVLSQDILLLYFDDFFFVTVMSQNFDVELRVDQFGQLDTQYYLQEAERLRSEEVGKLMAALKLRLKKLFKFDRIPSLEAVYGH